MSKPACVVPTCEGLIIRVGVHERIHKKALTLARKVVRRNLRGRWRVTPLAPRSRDFEVTRSGRRKSVPVGTAWNYAHQLKADRDVFDAEPALELSGLEPDPDHSHEQLTLLESTVAKSSGGDKHKNCSALRDWSIKGTRINKAWDLPLPPHGEGRRYGEGIRIGHPDTGYTFHPEIWKNPAGRQRVRVTSGYDFVDDKPEAYDPLENPHPSHGTKTASVIMSDIGAVTGKEWMTGAAPEASLYPYRVIKSVVVFNFKNVARAIYKAADSGCHVISMSLGGPFATGSIRNAIEYAIEQGVIVLAAAGNVWPWVVFPAKLPQVIAIAASNCERKPWKNSAHGDAVDISAPGESVWRAETLKENGSRGFFWSRGNGTSFAVATAAGACALWLAYHGRQRLIDKYGKRNLAAVFKEVLVTGGVDRPPGWKTDEYGSGILNAEKLLKAHLPDTPNAKGMGVTPKGKRAFSPSDPIADLQTYFPRAPRAALIAAVARELRCSQDHLSTMMMTMGDEIRFHVATNKGFRASIQNRLRGTRAKSTRRNPQLIRQASGAFKKQLNVKG